MSASAQGAPLERSESYQWPAEHVGHLSPGHDAALVKFKQICEEQGYYKSGRDGTPATHDEETLLRYLRARKFVPEEAFKQFKETEDWRRENQLDKLYETIDVNEYEASRRLYPQWIGRRDRRGIPFYVYEIGDLDPKAVTAYRSSKEKKSKSTNKETPFQMLRLFTLYENLCRFVLPMCSALPDRQHTETPISQSNNLVDMTGVSLSKLFNLRNHMSDASQLATAHYPETLDRIFVVGAPSYFPTVWGWIKNWFDPITVSKIFILSKNDMASTLSKYIDPENFPKQYGGKLDWKFGDLPNLEPSIVEAMDWKENIEQSGHKTLPTGPIRWTYNEKGDMEATAIGSENGQPRRRVIAQLKARSGVKKLALAPGMVQEQDLAATAVPKTPAAVERENPITAVESVPSANNEPVLKKVESSQPAGTDVNVHGQEPRTSVSESTRAEPTALPERSANMSERNTMLGASMAAAGGAGVAGVAAANGQDIPTRDEYPTSTPASSQPTESTPAAQSDGQSQEQDNTAPYADSRQGTSSTRYAQQADTHARGQMAQGTPATKIDGQGEKQGVMEPNTVGQAPKEYPSQHPEEPAPGMMAQAQDMAGQAVEQAKQLPGMVMHAAGYGEKEEEKPVEESKPEDPRIDRMDGANVEEFLRKQTMTRPAMGK